MVPFKQLCTNGLPRKLSNPSNKSSGFLCKNGANCAGKKPRTNWDWDCPLPGAAAAIPLPRATVASAAARLVRRTAAAVVVATTEADIWKALLLESFLLLSNFFFAAPNIAKTKNYGGSGSGGGAAARVAARRPNDAQWSFWLCYCPRNMRLHSGQFLKGNCVVKGQLISKCPLLVPPKKPSVVCVQKLKFDPINTMAPLCIKKVSRKYV